MEGNNSSSEEGSEEEITLATPGVIDKYQAAGKVTNCALLSAFFNVNRRFENGYGKMRRRCRYPRNLCLRRGPGPRAVEKSVQKIEKYGQGHRLPSLHLCERGLWA